MTGKVNGICETIVGFIIDYYRENLFYPSYDEISRGVGRTKSTIHTHMERLEMAGVIIRKADSSPQYRLINMNFILGHDGTDPGMGYSRWIPAENSPAGEEYILLSFENFQVPQTGRYKTDRWGGAYYLGDEEESCISQGMIVNAWMPLPGKYVSPDWGEGE